MLNKTSMLKALRNAILASIYITAVALLMFYGQKHIPGPDTFLAPVAMLSLLTLSAAIMGYLFVYEPATLFLANKRAEGVKLFFQTVGIFAVITAIVFIGVFAGLFR